MGTRRGEGKNQEKRQWEPGEKGVDLEGKKWDHNRRGLQQEEKWGGVGVQERRGGIGREEGGSQERRGWEPEEKGVGTTNQVGTGREGDGRLRIKRVGTREEVTTGLNNF